MADNHDNHAELSLAEQVAEWYASPVGQLIAEDIRTEYRRQVEDAFGYHAVILGSAGQSLQLTSQARIGHHVVADEHEGGALRLRPSALPFGAESLDLVTLAHVLDVDEAPVAVLREVDRCLRPEGKLVIIGFNPISLFSLARLFPRHCNRALRAGHRNLPWRIVEWLQVLGYEVDEVSRLAGSPAVCHAGTWKRMSGLRHFVGRFMPFLCGVYLIRATRRVSHAQIVRPAFHWRDLLPKKVPVSTQSGARRTHERR